jgi:hypothetical protein
VSYNYNKLTNPLKTYLKATMTEWKKIHPELTNQLQWEWYNRKFTAEQTKEWINIGLKPTDYQFAAYLRDIISCSPEETLNFGDLETLKEQYQEYLKHQATSSEEEDEDQTLANAIRLSLGIFSPDDLKPSDQELEKYLQEKRLDLKKYFVFNLGKEMQPPPKTKEVSDAPNVITLSDEEGNILGAAANVRKVEPILGEHLTQLFNDGYEKSAIAFAGKNTNQPSQAWMGDQLDHKIRNGEECYIVFDKTYIKNNLSYLRGYCLLADRFYIDSIVGLAMEVSPQVRVFQSKKNALRFLKGNDPLLFTKSLEEEERVLLEQMGIDGSKYEVAELKRMLEYADIAKRSIDKLPTGEGEIKKIIFFSPPHFQDKDCAVVVSEGKITALLPPVIFPFPPIVTPPVPIVLDNFNASLLVYEAPWQNNGWYLYVKKVKLCSKQDDAEKEADKLVKRLMDKNNLCPACAVFDKVGDVYRAFSFDCDVEGVEGLKVSLSAKNTPDGYFKPLDIVGVKNTGYFHVGIYLGKDKKGNHKVAQLTKANNDAEITDWSELFSDGSREVSRYHVFIPYKQIKLIKEHIAKAVASDEYSGSYPFLAVFGTGKYKKGNCQHFANRCILGLNISNEGTLFKKGESLREEIEKTNRHFNDLTVKNTNQKFHQARIKEINECVVVYKPLWEWKKPVELKPTGGCKLQ